jgi:hypothetical protein
MITLRSLLGAAAASGRISLESSAREQSIELEICSSRRGAMPVDSKTVAGRRTLRFSSLDEVVADAERLVASPDTKMLGNWSLGQILMHLARAVNGSIDGISFRAPWFIRLLGPWLKRRVLIRGMPAGFKLPPAAEATAFPTPASPQEALEILRQATARTKSETMSSPHPVFGALTHDEWRQLHLRHSELHLSFAQPG